MHGVVLLCDCLLMFWLFLCFRGQRPLTAPAVDLLNSHTAEFDAAQVRVVVIVCLVGYGRQLGMM